MTWHIDGATWRRYTTGRLDYSAQAAVETHLVGCAECQRRTAALSPDTETWQGVRAAITRPQPSWPLRWLRRWGLSDEDVVVLSASDNLRLPWAVALGGALASVVIAANLGRFEDVGFLLIGPLVPALAVLAAYDATDPLRQITSTTPYSKVRLGLLRTLATLLVALPSTVGLSAAIPGLRELTWTWLLPSLGLTSAALVALHWLGTWQAAALIAASWSATVLIINDAGRLDQLISVPGQAVCAVLAVACAAIFVVGTQVRTNLRGNQR